MLYKGECLIALGSMSFVGNAVGDHKALAWAYGTSFFDL